MSKNLKAALTRGAVEKIKSVICDKKKIKLTNIIAINSEINNRTIRKIEPVINPIIKRPSLKINIKPSN